MEHQKVDWLVEKKEQRLVDWLAEKMALILVDCLVVQMAGWRGKQWVVQKGKKKVVGKVVQTVGTRVAWWAGLKAEM